MKEILPGVFHWRIEWPGWFSLESFFLRSPEGSVLIDPIECAGLSDISAAGDVAAIILTVSYHERSARLFARRTGAPVFVPDKDVSMFEALDEVMTYEDGAALPGGLRAIGVPGCSLGEQALISPIHGGTLIVGDCLGTTAYWAPGGIPLGGHPKGHPRPAESLSHLLEYEFENLLPGHGDPILGGARTRLRELIETGKRMTAPEP